MTKSALIVEDHPIYRDALMTFLSSIFGYERVLTASSTEQAMAENNSRIGLILLDLGLPGLNGVEAVFALKKKFKSAAIIVISASEDRREVAAVLRAGVETYISKAVSIQIIAQTVRNVLAGEHKTGNFVTPKGEQMISEDPVFKLTPRQQEVLVVLCQGLSNKEIGYRLNLAEITVKIHISSIFRALGVVNRTQAVLEARRMGLYTPSI